MTSKQTVFRENLALPAQPSRGLMDGLKILQALAVSESPVGGRELGRQLGWNAMRVNRLLKTLAAIGLARQTPDRRYTAGPGMHVLSVQSLYASGLARRAIAAANDLPWQRHGVAMGVLWQDQVCYLFHTEPGQPPATGLAGHALYPATRSSIGMAVLAHWEVQTVRRLFEGRPIDAFASIGALLVALRSIRRSGHAFIEQAENPYQASIAVGIGRTPYAAIALSHGVTPETVDALLPSLRAAAERIAGDEAM